MCGISNRFVSDYRNFKKSGDKLDANELRQLSNLIVNAQGNPEAVKALQKEIMSDKVLDDDEKKLLLTIGFSTDSEDLQQIKSNLMPPSDEAISKLLDKGFQQRSQAVQRYRTENPNVSQVRDTAADAANTVVGAIKSFTPDFVRKGANAIMGRDNTRSSARVNTTTEAAIYSDNNTMNRFFNETNLRNLSAAERTDCVKNVLGAVGFKNAKNVGSAEINEASLKRMTGAEWDGVNVAHYKNNPSQLKNILNNQEGKAVVTVGAHTYTFKGLDNNGNLKVSDPSQGNIERTINKDNAAASVFIRKINGKGGDGAVTNNASGEAAAVGFNAFVDKNKSSKINSSDTADRSGESFNVRKLLVLMGDKSQVSAKNKIFDALETKNLSALQSALKASGINLQDQEAGAFMTKMTTRVDKKDDNGNKIGTDRKSVV